MAGADIEDVNALWKGLGYYSRAARLLAGAQKAVAAYGGRLPRTAAELEKGIPGIGRYSAGAIASIAYGECAPVVSPAPLGCARRAHTRPRSSTGTCTGS